MWSYILKRLLLMIPTLFGILLITFVVIQFVPGGPVEQMVAQLQGREAGGERAGRGGRQRLSRPPGRGREARRGDQEALRLRQAGARALRPDARAVRALRPRQELLPQQGRLAADPGEAAGVDQPRPVDLPADLPDLGAARHRQGGARRHAVRHRHDLHRAARLRDSELRDGRRAARVLRRRHVRAVVSAARHHLDQLGRAQPARQDRRLLLAHRAAGHRDGARRLRGHHHTHQELGAGGDPQAIRADRARQGRRRAQGAVAARVPQRADPDHDRLPGGVRRRVLRRLAPDRDAVLARRAGPALVRIGDPPRLSGRARQPVPVHASSACSRTCCAT